jgi:hypothetical protein
VAFLNGRTKDDFLFKIPGLNYFLTGNLEQVKGKTTLIKKYFLKKLWPLKIKP